MANKNYSRDRALYDYRVDMQMLDYDVKFDNLKS